MQKEQKAFLSLVVGFLSFLLNAFNELIVVLMFLMILDYITGVIKAIVLKQLDSSIGYKGILKKVQMLIVIAVAMSVDYIAGTLGWNTSNYISGAVICFFISNEGLSILENSAMMGLPIPKVLKSILNQIKDKSEKEEKEQK